MKLLLKRFWEMRWGFESRFRSFERGMIVRNGRVRRVGRKGKGTFGYVQTEFIII